MFDICKNAIVRISIFIDLFMLRVHIQEARDENTTLTW